MAVATGGEVTLVDDSENEWFEDYAEDADEIQIEEYDITASPNDFNVVTIYNFLEAGSVRIPGFQRNYVWDLGRASKLIESLLLGLPVPQIFLYESGRNDFLVIDGQQRLMSIYYFVKQRFPKKEKRGELRTIFDEHGKIPPEVLEDDEYFGNFRLKLPESSPVRPNRFKGLAYATLGSYKTQFDLRTIRNVIIKQNLPQDDNSSMYEVFNRLNTGGINLKPQEIRMSMYHSSFYDMLYRANSNPAWRRTVGNLEPDLHMKDVEILLRGLALLVDGANYAPSMLSFLNQFSRRSHSNGEGKNEYLSGLLKSFFEACGNLPSDAFLNKKSGRFNIALYEAAFSALCAKPFREGGFVTTPLSTEQLKTLESDDEFVKASNFATTQTRNVKLRLERATTLLGV